jgi:hypothetical protein
MLTADQFRINSNVNKITGKAPFDLILRFRLKIRMNIEAIEIKDNHNISGETPATRREIKLKKRDANLVRNI